MWYSYWYQLRRKLHPQEHQGKNKLFVYVGQETDMVMWNKETGKWLVSLGASVFTTNNKSTPEVDQTSSQE